AISPSGSAPDSDFKGATVTFLLLVMNMDNPTLYALASLLLLALTLLFASTRTSSHRPLPPGPRSTWFGKVELPKYQPWRTYASWKDMYAQVISDLLEKRSGNYSSRPLRFEPKMNPCGSI
ncbi:hypothetical protein MPER_15087, partial [Moniliophthora perniciosa FA553]